MALTVAQFQAAFREFRKTDPTVIETTMARCARAVSSRVWCDQTDDGVGLLTAHRLKQMAFGTSTAEAPASPLGPDDDYSTTEYGREFRTLRDGIVAPRSMTTWGGGWGGR